MASLKATMNVHSEMELAELQKSGSSLVVAFWAEWHPPSQQMLSVVDELAKEHKDIHFVKVEAEKYPEITSQFPTVKSVPTFIFARGSQVDATLEGASAPALVDSVKLHASRSSSASSLPTPAPAPAPDDLNTRLSKLINASPVMLFMKGSPDAPRCGFSRQIVEIIRSVNVPFGHFDILTDESVRQGLKTFSNWPTYPQVYAQGKLIGGLDIVKELQADGQLADALQVQSNAAPQKDPLHQRLEELINQRRVMVFMKGTPQQPRCGFSAKIVSVLNEVGADYGSFDILEDNSVREGLKTYSNWPTYPQLYVNGKLVGGLDIVQEMHSEGQLAELLQDK